MEERKDVYKRQVFGRSIPSRWNFDARGEKRILMVQVGEKAPDFALQNARGETVRLGDFKGKKLVLYFYPKDNTPGCTRQACAFGANYAGFQSLNAVVIGVSKDSVASHVKFLSLIHI